MKNNLPIFVNGIARSGTAILLSMISSHPSVVNVTGELQAVSRGGAIEDMKLDRPRKILSYYIPLFLMLGRHYFTVENVEERSMPSHRAARFIDHMLYKEKFRAMSQKGRNMYKMPGVKYSVDEIENARLVCKNIGGLALLTPMFHHIYPDACFIAIVRNGLANLESHIRRGFDLDYFTEYYNRVTTKMIEYRDRIEKYLIVWYEDIVRNPLEKMKEIYAFAGLSYSQLTSVKFRLKSTVQRDGTILIWEKTTEVWCGINLKI